MKTPGIRSMRRRAVARLAAGAAAAAAAVLALGIAGTASAASTVPGWYGYVVTGSTYASVTADWTVPSVRCVPAAGTYASIWAGLDGYSSATIEQAGTDSACDGTAPDYYAWYELYPAGPVIFSNPVQPGDSIAVSVLASGSKKITLTLHDTTQGWTQTVHKSLAGAALSSAEAIAEVPSNFSCAAACTIAAFTGVTVDGSPLGSDNPQQVTGGDAQVTVSPVSGSAFTVSWKPKAALLASRPILRRPG
jgi:hypothetical protein